MDPQYYLHISGAKYKLASIELVQDLAEGRIVWVRVRLGKDVPVEDVECFQTQVHSKPFVELPGLVDVHVLVGVVEGAYVC